MYFFSAQGLSPKGAIKLLLLWFWMLYAHSSCSSFTGALTMLMSFPASSTVQEPPSTCNCHRINRHVSTDWCQPSHKHFPIHALIMFHSSSKNLGCANQWATQMWLPNIPSSYQPMSAFFCKDVSRKGWQCKLRSFFAGLRLLNVEHHSASPWLTRDQSPRDM